MKKYVPALIIFTALTFASPAFLNIAGLQTEVLAADQYLIAENDQFSFEYPSEWTSWDVEGTLFASRDGTEAEPVFSVCREDTALTAGEMLVQRKAAYEATYKERMSRLPEIITYQVSGSERSLAGFKGEASSSDGSRTLACAEFIEDRGGVIYRYFCSYVSHSNNGDEAADETTWQEFLHAVDTMTIK